MPERDWINIMDGSALPEDAMTAVYPKGVNVLLARISGKLHAFDGKCAHMGCALFCGSLAGHILTCPCHDWRYDLRTGEFIDAPELKLRAYAVKESDGRIFVKIGDTEVS